MDVPKYTRAIWGNPEPGRLLGPGHRAGDFLNGPDWRIVEESEGRFLVDVPLVPEAKNYRGHLFGGFAPAYIDLIALRTVSAGRSLDVEHGWLLTLGMRVDYFEPVEGPRFLIESHITSRRGRTIFVEIRFRDLEGKLLLFATATLLEQKD
jgi:acyl-coenzyme A thioesterase PaaI-like protein